MGIYTPSDQYWTLDKCIVLQVGGCENTSLYSQQMNILSKWGGPIISKGTLADLHTITCCIKNICIAFKIYKPSKHMVHESGPNIFKI